MDNDGSLGGTREIFRGARFKVALEALLKLGTTCLILEPWVLAVFRGGSGNNFCSFLP